MSRNSSFIGKKIGDYTILEEIGRDSIATTYRGKDDKLNRLAIVKVFHIFLNDPPNLKGRFFDWARTIALLEHPNILPIYQFGTFDDQPYLAMKSMPGESLYNRVAHGSFYAMPELAQPAKQIASAIDFMHTRGILHHDIKPHNILLDERGKAYLTEPMLMIDTKSTPIGSIIASPTYMSPEVSMADNQSTSASDLYGFGITLYELLVGQPPFNGETPMAIAIQHISEPVPSLGEIDASLTPADPIFARMLAKTREERYTSASAFVHDLTNALQEDKRVPNRPIAPKTTHSRASTKQLASPPPESDFPHTTPMQIFVSYAVVDSALRENVVSTLREQQHSVWFDGLLENRGGQSWWNIICKQIRESELFVFVLSKNSLNSVACQREYEYAYALHKRIMPVKIADFNFKIDLPRELSELQVVNFTDDKGASSLAHSMANLSDARPLPDPLPSQPDVPMLPVQEFANELRITPYGELKAKRQEEIIMALELMLLKGNSGDDVIMLLEQTRNRGDWTEPMGTKIDKLIKDHKPRCGFFGFSLGRRK